MTIKLGSSPKMLISTDKRLASDTREAIGHSLASSRGQICEIAADATMEIHVKAFQLGQFCVIDR